MFVRALVLPLAVQLIASSPSGVPYLNVQPSCNGAASAGSLLTGQDAVQACLNSEQRTREKLEQTWSSFSAADRSYCIASMGGFEPTYTELATCLEMQRDVRNIRNNPSAMQPSASSPSPAPKRPMPRPGVMH
jgi:hypothetical protein